MSTAACCSRRPACASWMSAKSASRIQESSNVSGSLVRLPRTAVADRRSSPTRYVSVTSMPRCGMPCRIARLFVTRLAAAAAFVDRNLGIGVDELELIGRDRRGFAQPQPLTVDLEPHGAQEARLPEIEAGERACSSGVARCCHDEQRGPVPGAQNVVADECARASTLESRGDGSASWGRSHSPLRRRQPPAGRRARRRASRSPGRGRTRERTR